MLPCLVHGSTCKISFYIRLERNIDGPRVFEGYVPKAIIVKGDILEFLIVKVCTGKIGIREMCSIENSSGECCFFSGSIR